jgi:hypothetical protein
MTDRHSSRVDPTTADSILHVDEKLTDGTSHLIPANPAALGVEQIHHACPYRQAAHERFS